MAETTRRFSGAALELVPALRWALTLLVVLGARLAHGHLRYGEVVLFATLAAMVPVRAYKPLYDECAWRQELRAQQWFVTGLAGGAVLSPVVAALMLAPSVSANLAASAGVITAAVAGLERTRRNVIQRGPQTRAEAKAVWSDLTRLRTTPLPRARLQVKAASSAASLVTAAMGFAFVLGAADRGQFVSVAFLVATAVFLLVLYRDLDRIGGTGAHGACMVLPMGAVFAALGLERLTDAGNVAVLGGALPLLAATVLIGERARRRGTARLR